MSKLVEAAAEFLSRDTSTKGNEFNEAMHSMSPMSPMKKKMEMEAMAPMKKKMAKKEMDESFLLSQEEFQSLSEEDREYYVKQLMELKNGMMKSNKMEKKSKMM